MATQYPAQGSVPWDATLKAYIDSSDDDHQAATVAAVDADATQVAADRAYIEGIVTAVSYSSTVISTAAPAPTLTSVNEWTVTEPTQVELPTGALPGAQFLIHVVSGYQDLTWPTGSVVNGTTSEDDVWVGLVRETSHWSVFVSGAGSGGGFSGNGSPEGVVTATTGDRYVDNVAATGAVEWVKTTATGNTGWKVTYGDTGWRTLIAGTVASGTTTYTVGSAATWSTANWGPYPAAAKGEFEVSLRRVNDVCWLRIGGVQNVSGGSTPGAIVTVSGTAGFGSGTGYAGGLRVQSAVPLLAGGVALVQVSSAVTADVVPVNAVLGWGNANVSGPVLVNYTTYDDWPSTLPGVAS